MKTYIRTVGAQFKLDDPEFYGKIIPAEKKSDNSGTYYEFGDGAFIGYPLNSEYPEYAVIEVSQTNTTESKS